MDLIPQLKQEHREILRLSGLNDVCEFREILLSHLEVEDKLLYPALLKCKEKKPKELATQFSREMASISKAAMAFFRKYEKIRISVLATNPDFKKEHAEINTVIRKRIMIEESILFPAYRKYVKGG